MTNNKKEEALLSFGEDLIATCGHLFHTSKIEGEHEDISNPKVLSLTLLLRSVNNFAAMRALLREGFIVEARTVVRSIYENLFWLAALSKKGEEFVAGVVGHDGDTRLKRGRELLSWAKKQTGPLNFEEKLGDVLKDLSDNQKKTFDVGYKSSADAGGLGDGYIIYRVLSTDSAHPSATSLSRHLSDDPQSGALTFHGSPISEDGEHVDTLELASSALLGVCVAANELLKEPVTGKSLEVFFDRWRALQRPEGLNARE